jgi:hypothetical protein
MRPALVAYVGAVSLLGTSLFVSSLASVSRVDLLTLTILTLLAFLAECLVLRSLPGMTHSLSTLVYLAAIPLVPVHVVPVFAFIGLFAASFRLGKPWYKAIFNGGQVALTTTIGSQLWWQTTGGTPDGKAFLDHILVVALVAGVFYLVNSWIIAVVSSLDQLISLWAAWSAGRRGLLLPQLGVCVGSAARLGLAGGSPGYTSLARPNRRDMGKLPADTGFDAQERE